MANLMVMFPQDAVGIEDKVREAAKVAPNTRDTITHEKEAVRCLEFRTPDPAKLDAIRAAVTGIDGVITKVIDDHGGAGDPPAPTLSKTAEVTAMGEAGTPLDAAFNTVRTVGGTVGSVRLPAAVLGMSVIVKHALTVAPRITGFAVETGPLQIAAPGVAQPKVDAKPKPKEAPLNVLPADGEEIGDLGADKPFAVEEGSTVMFGCVETGYWGTLVALAEKPETAEQKTKREAVMARDKAEADAKANKETKAKQQEKADKDKG